MRTLLWLLALAMSSLCAGIAIGNYTVHGAALAVAPGPVMPHVMIDGDG